MKARLSGNGNSVNSGIVADFLKECDLAFKQLLFDQTSHLVTAMTAYLEGRPYRFSQSTLYSDAQTRDNLTHLENKAVVR